jgi:hypothetical protein
MFECNQKLSQCAKERHSPPPKTDKMAGHFLLKRSLVSKSRILFEISLIFVELFLFSSLPMGRGKSGRDLQFLFLFFQQNCFHMSGNCKYFAIFWFMGLACLANFALIYL